jgi:hypothetical protein
MPLDGVIRTLLHAVTLYAVMLTTVVLHTVVLHMVVRAVARIGMLGAVVGMRRGAALVTWVPAIHANVICGGMGPR